MALDFYGQLRFPNQVNCRNDLKKTTIKNRVIKARISRFYNRLSGELSPDLLERFNNNVSTLRVNYKIKLLKPNKCTTGDASYNSFSNEIELYDLFDKNISSLEHELLHMASSLITPFRNGLDNANLFLGFRDGYLGVGLNEGYTQLLVERYFNNGNHSYRRVVDIVQKLEFIIGADKMTSLYFGDGLKGLYQELLKLDPNSKNHIAKFISELDYLVTRFNDLEAHYVKDEIITGLYKQLACFYTRKLYLDYINQEKTFNDIMDEYNKYCDLVIMADFNKENLSENFIVDADKVIGNIQLEQHIALNNLKKKINGQIKESR